jgi:hypothetical protein
VKRNALVSLVVLSAALILTSAAGAQETPPPQSAPEAAPAPPPAPKPYEEVIKLWKANLSEDFIKRQILTGTTVYDLSADEVIRCRDAGLPESLINIMLDTRYRKAADARPAAPAPAAAAAATSAPAAAAPAAAAKAAAAPPAAPVAAAAPSAATAPSAPSAPSLAAEANRRWEGLARRNSGIVLKSRWDVGILEFKEETVRWLDAKDASKNLLIPARQIKEQFLTCEKKSGGNECFEWGIRTKDGEYKWRDIAWEQGENAKVQELFEFMKGMYPGLVSSNVPVDKK